MQSSYQRETSNNNPISEASQNKSLEENPSFSPFLFRSLTCSDPASICYNQRQNLLVIASDNTLLFYDATDFRKINTHRLYDLPRNLSYCEEIDTFLFGCESGCIYSYNASKNELKKIQKAEGNVLKIEFLGSKFYAFLLAGTKDLYIGNLESENSVRLDYSKTIGLHYSAQRKLLFTSFYNGSVKVFKLNNLPHLQAFCGPRLQQDHMIYAFYSFCIKGKDYLITSCLDQTLKIWYLIKGRMRLLKVVQTEEKTADSVVYLENSNMVAVSYKEDHIDFFKVPSWKLERKFCFEEFEERYGLFLMKDKNVMGCIGDLGLGYQAIHFIQLYNKEENLSCGS